MKLRGTTLLEKKAIYMSKRVLSSQPMYRLETPIKCGWGLTTCTVGVTGQTLLSSYLQANQTSQFLLLLLLKTKMCWSAGRIRTTISRRLTSIKSFSNTKVAIPSLRRPLTVTEAIWSFSFARTAKSLCSSSLQKTIPSSSRLAT